MPDRLAALINAAWEDRAELTTDTTGEVREAVDASLSLLDSGEVRVAEPDGEGGWTVNEWLKKAVLLSFRLNPNVIMDGGPGHRGTWWDKVPSKFEGWGGQSLKPQGFGPSRQRRFAVAHISRQARS